MTDNDDATELTTTVVMLFDSALASGTSVAMRPNALLIAPPESLVADDKEAVAHRKFINSIKMRSVLQAFKNKEGTSEDLVLAMAQDMAMWSLIGGYVWARDHDVLPLATKMLRSVPLETGVDKWTPEQCKELGVATAGAIMRRFNHGPEVVASIAPFAAWNTGKKLFQFEQDGALLAMILEGDADA